MNQAIVKPNEHVVEGFPANVMPQDYGLRLSEQDIDRAGNVPAGDEVR